MNIRIQQIVAYKTGGRQREFCDLVGWKPPYLTKLLHGDGIGLSPILTILRAFPEIDARWLLFGTGEMLPKDYRANIRIAAAERAREIMDISDLVPVMTEEELSRFERSLVTRQKADFSPEELSSLTKRANARKEGLNARVTAAMAKSLK